MGQIQKMVLGLLQLGFDVKYIAEELERPERQIIRIRTRLIELGEIEENGQSKRTRRSTDRDDEAVVVYDGTTTGRRFLDHGLEAAS